MNHEIHSTPEQRLYVRARGALVTLLAVLYFLEVDVPGAHGRTLYAGFLLLLAVSTVVLHLYQVRYPRRLTDAMLWVLPSDLLCVMGFSYLLYSIEDAFYPVAVLLPVVLALYVQRETAWVIGMASAAAYVTGHLLADHSYGINLIMFAAAAGAIPVLTGIVADSTENRRRHERETRIAAAERAEALDQLGRRVSELQAVSQVTDIIHSSLDFDGIGPLVLEVLSKVIGVDTCCLFVIDKDKSETLFSASIGMPDSAIASPERLMDDAMLDDHFSCMAIFDHAATMVLLCASADDIARMTEDDRLVLGAVASELAVAVENSRLYRLTKKLAITDELTGLANYRHLQTRLDDEIERARRYGKNVSLIMLDVDDFKGFNDAHGHIAGDHALADLAEVLERNVREVDLVARYGGEEFSVVLPETDAPGAYVAAEKLREAVATHLFADADGARRIGMTVSMGLATYPVHASDKEALLRESDDALYRAKNDGKNRVKTPGASKPWALDARDDTTPDRESATGDADTTGA